MGFLYHGVSLPFTMGSDPMVSSIVAGAGIWGCTVARRLAEAGRKVMVLEKRPVVNGNVRCECVDVAP